MRHTAMDSQKRETVVDYIKAVSVCGRKIPITDDTEIYYDLQLYGDDLYAFFVWLEKKFGVPINMNPQDYGPGEGPPPLLFRKWRKRRELEQRRYKSLKVRDILAAIDTGGSPG